MVDPTTFKDMMAWVATTVTVVTTIDDGRPAGLTVSAFTSISVDPPIVSVAIDSNGSSLPVFENADGFTVNFLPDDQREVAMLFAAHGAERFATTAVRDPERGVGGPVLEVAFGHFECRSIAKLMMGDHLVVFGEVVAGGRDRDADPLVWLRRGFVDLGRS